MTEFAVQGARKCGRRHSPMKISWNGIREKKARLDELEQQDVPAASAAGASTTPMLPSWGAQIAGKLDEAKSYFENRGSKGSVSYNVKTIITSGSGSGADLLICTAT